MNEKEIIEEWSKSKVFDSNPDKRKKYFITVPYPYTSGPLHVGHARSYTYALFLLEKEKVPSVQKEKKCIESRNKFKNIKHRFSQGF